MRLNHVTLPAFDVAGCADFYRRLGLRLIVDALPDYVRFELPTGEATLSLERAPAPAAGGPILFLECDDLDHRVEALTRKGVAFDSPPTDRPWLWREARLTDPAGNRLCLFYAGTNHRFPPWRIG